MNNDAGGKSASNVVLGPLPPQRAGQAHRMLRTQCGIGDDCEQELGHWESPALIQRRIAAAVAAERERIADMWAGCTTEAEGHGPVDIGASIRAGRLVDARA